MKHINNANGYEFYYGWFKTLERAERALEHEYNTGDLKEGDDAILVYDKVGTKKDGRYVKVFAIAVKV